MGYLLSFRVRPADEETINLLNEKELDHDFSVQTIYQVDIYNFDPPQLLCLLEVESEELEFHSKCNSLHTVQTQQLPIHHMTYNFRNHVAENSFSRVQPQQLPNRNLLFDSRNHVAENNVQVVEHEQVTGHSMTFNYRNHVVENIFATEELQQLLSHHLASDSRNHVAENIFPGGRTSTTIKLPFVFVH